MNAKQLKVDQVARAIEGRPLVEGGYMVRTPSWKARLLRPFFPHQHIEAPEAGHYMRSNCCAYLDWRDRLRVLVTGRINVDTLTKTSEPVRAAMSESVVYVPCPGAGA